MPSAALSAEHAMTLYIVGRRPWRAAWPGADGEEPAAPDVQEEGPARAAGAVAEKLHRAVLLESPMDGRVHTCS